jgi:CRISPR/Cas system-associated exonuclease Cas4 (RecB family)
MPVKRSLFNLNRIVSESGKDTPPEVSFLADLDYTIRSLNKESPHYYFKKITKENNPEYFNKKLNVVCLTTLPEICDGQYFYDKIGALIHTNDQNYYVCLYDDGKPSKRYKPSSMNCIRSMYYQVTGADLDKKTDKSGDFYGICESGEDRHIRIQRAVSSMRSKGVDCDFVDVEKYIRENNLDLVVESKKEFETKLYDPKRNLVFLCDGIIRYKDKYYILEIKTEISFKWMSRESYDDKHKIQAFAYSLELGIDDVLFLYENRDICTKKSFLVHVSDADRKYIDDRISTCNEFVEKHISPPVESTISNKVCQYCEYHTVCKLDGR